LKAALIQLTSGDSPVDNLPVTLGLIRQAADAGAGFILTPEVTNCVSNSRAQQNAVLQLEETDQTLAAICDLAKALQVWVSIGSLGLQTGDPDGRFANRSFLIDPIGQITARYDKLHMYDVDLSATESYRESDGYRPGQEAVIAETPFATLGLSICYDIRFAHLYHALARAGAQVLLIPAAFSPTTGVAHWESLLRARAIETGCYVLAAAQSGTHPTTGDSVRKTHGHSMAISPWGEVLIDAGQDQLISYVDLDLKKVAQARQSVPSLAHVRSFKGP
jgi:predicted amidohydrolase